MAGFENVVRPVVFPNIRPQPARSLPPAEDPEKGFCVIKGNGATVVDLSYSFSMSMSKSRSVETERRVDEVRVYQEEDDGSINEDNFIDLDVANRIRTREGAAPRGGNMPRKVDNFGGQVTHGDIVKQRFFKRQEEAPNVEIRDRDLIRNNTDPNAAGSE